MKLLISVFNKIKFLMFKKKKEKDKKIDTSPPDDNYTIW